MAFGPPPASKFKGTCSTAADENWRSSIRAEETATRLWQRKWGWTLVEYEKVRENLKDLSEKYNRRLPVLAKHLRKESRVLKPFPETENQKLGWLAKRPEFRLEKYGPDIYKGMPFKNMSEF